MDALRLEILSKHIGEMDSGLIDMVKRYIEFTDNKKPRIAVLCSDQRMRMEMEQIFTSRTDVDAVVCGTYAEIGDIYDLMLSDAVIAVTNVLQIAPKGMYELLERLSCVAKEIYFLLGGWESLPKTSEMRTAKAERVVHEFPFSKIVHVKNYYAVEIEGFLLPKQAADEYVRFVKTAFSRLHASQNEKIYLWLKEKIAYFYVKCTKEIREEILLAVKCSHKIATKQNRFALELTHSAVSMQNVVERVVKYMSDITVSDLEVACGNLVNMVKEDKHYAERLVKKVLAELLVKSLDSCMGDYDSPVKIKARATVEECVCQMKDIEAEIVNAKYVSDELRKQFTYAVEHTDDLNRIVERYDEIARLTLERARERIPAVVNSYYYSMTPQTMDKLRGFGSSVLHTVSDGAEQESNESDKSIVSSYVDKFCTAQKDYSEDTEIEYFFKNTANMLQDVLTQSTAMIYDCGREVTKEINEYSALMINGYFGSLTTVLQHVEKYLEALLDSYVLD